MNIEQLSADLAARIEHIKLAQKQDRAKMIKSMLQPVYSKLVDTQKALMCRIEGYCPKCGAFSPDNHWHDDGCPFDEAEELAGKEVEI